MAHVSAKEGRYANVYGAYIQVMHKFRFEDNLLICRVPDLLVEESNFPINFV